MSTDDTHARPTYVVAKFGGTSVASPERWSVIGDVARRLTDEGHRVVLVCSAVAGISDKLQSLAEIFEDAEACASTLETIRRVHRELATGLEVDMGLVVDTLHDLERLVAAARTLGYMDPRTRARLLSVGELMSTRLGAARLVADGLDAEWTDARELLVALPDSLSEDRRWLSAACSAEVDDELRAKLDRKGQVIVTQGFIASDQETGDTVVLGRGGSDTSAAYLAARLNAERLEIWTDVDGLYSAHPGVVEEAHRLDEVDFSEAETLASLGASVLHPRCIDPVRKNDVELHVRCTTDPDQMGTVVKRMRSDPSVRAVAHREDLYLVKMSRRGEWQEVGVLADITDCFRRHHLSIDMMASAPETIQATLDPAASPLGSERFDNFLEDLSQFCVPRVVPGMATVSIVGHALHGSTGQIAPALRKLEAYDIGAVIPGADGRHVTFVVKGDDAPDMVREVHRALFPPDVEIDGAAAEA